MKKVLIKYKHFILYTVFGALTTLVNIASYWLFAHLLRLGVMPSTILAWILAVAFAYITNRRFVFDSKTNDTAGVIKEIFSFFSLRLATGIFDWLSMFIFVDLLHFNDIAIKFAANIVVIVLNYIFGKLVIFKSG